MKTNRYLICFLTIASLLTTLSCSLTTLAADLTSPTVDETKVALAVAATESAAKNAVQEDPTKQVLALEATKNAESATQLANADQQKSAEATKQADSATQAVIDAAAQTQLAQPTISPTPDMTDKIKHAKILVYEDTQDIGNWITEALDGMDVEYTHVGDASGNFMKNLDSSIQWDLIIVGAESRSSIQGEFWDVINRKMIMSKTALIAEVWYLKDLGGGKIRNVMTNCGISYQSNWPLAESIFWTEPDHPLFTAFNTAMPLINYNRYWTDTGGDFVRLIPGSTAHIVAGAYQKHNTDYGLITVCMDGRMVFQTFSNHDFHHDDVVKLWQNYIVYTLTNHFNATGQ